jgi:hypothetical protein
LLGILSAVFWFSLCFYAWPVDLRNVETFSGLLFWAALQYVAPCVAVGVLFGRATYGFIVGTVGLLIWIVPALLRFWDVI